MMPMPEKVLFRARELGVEEDCLMAGPDTSCRRCYAIVMSAFDTYYETVDPQEIRSRIVGDALRGE